MPEDVKETLRRFRHFTLQKLHERVCGALQVHPPNRDKIVHFLLLQSLNQDRIRSARPPGVVPRRSYDELGFLQLFIVVPVTERNRHLRLAQRLQY
jgi:hypothetical protein